MTQLASLTLELNALLVSSVHGAIVHHVLDTRLNTMRSHLILRIISLYYLFNSLNNPMSQYSYYTHLTGTKPEALRDKYLASVV